MNRSNEKRWKSLILTEQNGRIKKRVEELSLLGPISIGPQKVASNLMIGTVYSIASLEARQIFRHEIAQTRLFSPSVNFWLEGLDHG